MTRKKEERNAYMTLHRDTTPSAADASDAERKKIVACMHRLLTTEKPRVVALDDRLVIDTLRREVDVTRSALTLTHRHVELKKKSQNLQTRATHGEGAARHLARTVAAQQMLYATATAWLDAIISDVALEDLKPKPSSNVSLLCGRRRK